MNLSTIFGNSSTTVTDISFSLTDLVNGIYTLSGTTVIGAVVDENGRVVLPDIIYGAVNTTIDLSSYVSTMTGTWKIRFAQGTSSSGGGESAPISVRTTDLAAAASNVGKVWMRSDASTPTIKTVTQSLGVGGLESIVLLLPCDGASNGTTFIDSTGLHTVTAYGDAVTSLVQAKFGSSSLRVTSNGYLNIPASTDFNLGTTWTIDFWAYFPTLTTYQKPISTRGNGGDGYEIMIDTSYKMGIEGFGSNLISGGYFGNTALTAATWHHLAYVNYNGSLKGYLNGALEFTYPNSFVWSAGGHNFRIGSTDYFAEQCNGFFDEVKITKSALWTSNFVPPISAKVATDYVYTVKTLQLV